MVTQQQALSADIGPSWPDVTGFGALAPTRNLTDFPAGENPLNLQVSIHLPCLQFLSRIRDNNGYHEKRVITKREKKASNGGIYERKIRDNMIGITGSAAAVGRDAPLKIRDNTGSTF